MSNTDNPFQSPQYIPPTQPSFDATFQPPKPGPVTMEYMRIYNFIFENPNWFTNLLLLALCTLIPVVGGIVILGYQFAVVESLHRRSHRSYPDFDFNRFSEYLTRGVWPFLVSLIVMVIIVPLVYVVMFAGIFLVVGIAGAVGQDWGGVVAAVAGVLSLIAYFAFVFAVNLVIQPMFLAAGLSQDLGQGFNLGFVRDFASRVWKEITLLWIFTAFTGMFVVLLGYVACFVGVFLSIGVLMLAQAHGYFQLYELYLSRGGMQIPLKTELPPTMR